MPTYEYECSRCGLITEEFKPISAPKRQRCPACRGKVERLISGGAGLHFKGSGFYINDSRAKKGNTAGEAQNSPTSSSSNNTKKADKNKG